jgi:MFS superfamily sulfate permease-like transporter
MATRAAQTPEGVSGKRSKRAGLAGWAPGVAALRGYRREWLPQDLTAGLVLSALLVPQGMAYAELRRLLAMRKAEFALAVACALGVALVGVLGGIVITLGVAIGQFFWRAWRPYSAVLGRPPDVAGFHDLTRYPDAAQIPGMLVLRWDAPLFFANAGLFRDMVRRRLAEATPAPRWVLLAAEPITDVDTTAAEVLADLDEELNAGGVHLVFAGLKDPVKDRMVRYGLLETIARRHFFPTLEVAVEAFERAARDGAPGGELSRP